MARLCLLKGELAALRGQPRAHEAWTRRGAAAVTGRDGLAARINLAVALADRSTPEAIEMFQEVVEDALQAGDSRSAGVALLNLGGEYLRCSATDEALACLGGGILMAMVPFLAQNPDPSEQEVRHALSGNICRCTGYQHIVDAVLEAARRSRNGDG